MYISPTATSAIAGASPVAAGASYPMTPSKKMSNLFDQISPSGSDSINQSQFQQAFKSMNPPPSFQAAGANAVWSQLDPNGTGSVSKQDFVSGMSSLMKQLRGGNVAPSSTSGAQELTQSTTALDALGGSGSILNAFA